MADPDAKTIRPWTFAGIMLSYWCNARCEFCYVSCGPDADHWVDPAEAVRWWRQLAELARSKGKRVRIHLTGGEPFGNWPVLLATARRAHAEGLTADGAFQKVETNAFWADSEHIVHERIAELDRLGMGKLAVSADPFHQQYITPDRVRTCVRTARQILGEDRVQVRWLDWYEQMQDLGRMPRPQRAEIIRSAMARHAERLVGRGSRWVASLLQGNDPGSFADQTCRRSMLAAKHVHIDPCGHVFPGTCAGIILGNASRESIARIYARTTEQYDASPVLSALIQGGPHALLHDARIRGFEPRSTGYANKCHLCSHIRQFLFEQGCFKDAIGPQRCYPLDRGRR